MTVTGTPRNTTLRPGGSADRLRRDIPLKRPFAGGSGDVPQQPAGGLRLPLFAHDEPPSLASPVGEMLNAAANAVVQICLRIVRPDKVTLDVNYRQMPQKQRYLPQIRPLKSGATANAYVYAIHPTAFIRLAQIPPSPPPLQD